MYRENQHPTANSGLAVEQSATGTYRKLSLRLKDNALSASIVKALSSYQQDDVDKRTTVLVACHHEAATSPEAPIATEDCSSLADQLRGEILAAQKAAAAARAEADATEVFLSRVTSERDENYRVAEKLRYQLRTVRDQLTDENEVLRAENDKLRSENARADEEARLAGEENRRCSPAAGQSMMANACTAAIAEELRLEREGRARRESETDESMHSLGRQVHFLASDNTSLVKKLQRIALSLAPTRLFRKKQVNQQQPDTITRETASHLGATTAYSGASSSRPHEHQVLRRPSFTSSFQKANSDPTVTNCQEPNKLQASCISHVSESDLARHLR